MSEDFESIGYNRWRCKACGKEFFSRLNSIKIHKGSSVCKAQQKRSEKLAKLERQLNEWENNKRDNYRKVRWYDNQSN